MSQHSENTVSKLTIAASQPFVRVESRLVAFPSTSSDSRILHTGLCEKISQVVEHRRRFLQPRRMIIVCSLFLGGLTYLGTDWLYSAITSKSPIQIGTVVVLTLLGISLSAWPFWTDRPYYAVIHFIRRSDKPSFFARKKDDLILAIVSASNRHGTRHRCDNLVPKNCRRRFNHRNYDHSGSKDRPQVTRA